MSERECVILANWLLIRNGFHTKSNETNNYYIIDIAGCYNPIIYGLMNSRFKACFIAVLYRIPGFQKIFARRLRGTRDRYPNNGESIFLALNHQSCMSKNQTNRLAKINDDHFKNGDVGTINGTNFSFEGI